MGIIFSQTTDGRLVWKQYLIDDNWWDPFSNSVVPPNSSIPWNETDPCLILAEKDELFYWSTPAQPGAATTVVHGSHTFTSPTVYMHWKTIFATGHSSGSLGTTFADTIFGYDPNSISTMVNWPFNGASENIWLPMQFTDFNQCVNHTWQAPATTTGTISHRAYTNLTASSERVVYGYITRTITFNGQTLTIYNNPCKPVINWPINNFNLDHRWQSCAGVWIEDPPYALTPAIEIPTPTRRYEGLESLIASITATTRNNGFALVPITERPNRIPSATSLNHPPHPTLSPPYVGNPNGNAGDTETFGGGNEGNVVDNSIADVLNSAAGSTHPSDGEMLAMDPLVSSLASQPGSNEPVTSQGSSEPADGTDDGNNNDGNSGHGNNDGVGNDINGGGDGGGVDNSSSSEDNENGNSNNDDDDGDTNNSIDGSNDGSNASSEDQAHTRQSGSGSGGDSSHTQTTGAQDIAEAIIFGMQPLMASGSSSAVADGYLTAATTATAIASIGVEETAAAAVNETLATEHASETGGGAGGDGRGGGEVLAVGLAPGRKMWPRVSVNVLWAFVVWVCWAM